MNLDKPHRRILKLCLWGILAMSLILPAYFLLHVERDNPVRDEVIKYHAGELGSFYYFDDATIDTLLDEDGTITGINDENGVRMVDMSRQHPFLGLVYHPQRISAVCIGYFGGYIATGKVIYKDIVLKHADWLVENQVETEKAGAWIYSWPNTGFGAQPPWISAMTQGRPYQACVGLFS